MISTGSPVVGFVLIGWSPRDQPGPGRANLLDWDDVPEVLALTAFQEWPPIRVLCPFPHTWLLLSRSGWSRRDQADDGVLCPFPHMVAVFSNWLDPKRSAQMPDHCDGSPSQTAVESGITLTALSKSPLADGHPVRAGSWLLGSFFWVVMDRA